MKAPRAIGARVQILDTVGNVVGWGTLLGQVDDGHPFTQDPDRSYVVQEDRQGPGVLTLFHGSRLIAVGDDSVMTDCDPRWEEQHG